MTVAENAQATQGPGTASAGQEVAATGVSSQAPAAPPQQQTATGAIRPTAATLVPTNAETFQAADQISVSQAPLTLPAANDPAPAGTDNPSVQAVLPPVEVTATSLPDDNDVELSYIYKAITVVSVFERGKFTQELDGSLLIFPEPLKRVVLATEELGYQSLPVATAPDRNASPVPGTPPVLPGAVTRDPNSSNLAQQAISSPAQPVAVAESSDTISAGQTAPTSSEGQVVSVPVSTQQSQAGNPVPNQNMVREN